MTTYLVHLPAAARPGSVDGLDRVVLVRDGFHWWALVVPLLWLLFNRLWLAFLAMLVISLVVAFGGAAAGLPEPAVVALELLLSLALAVNAAAVQSWTLARNGAPVVDVVTGADEEDATRRFYDRWLARTPGASPAGSEPPPRSRTVPASGPGPVLGLFPEAGRT